MLIVRSGKSFVLATIQRAWRRNSKPIGHRMTTGLSVSVSHVHGRVACTVRLWQLKRKGLRERSVERHWTWTTTGLDIPYNRSDLWLNFELGLLYHGEQPVSSFRRHSRYIVGKNKRLSRSKNKHKPIAISETHGDSRMWKDSRIYRPFNELGLVAIRL